jgi:aryl-alcohol dehydrogenase-like predicted oxidoreductase
MRKLGSAGPLSSDIGLGCMGMSDMYGPSDEGEGIATIHAALDAGITLLDTGDYYGMGHNELLIRKALEGRKRENVVISVKFGALRDPQGNWIGYDGRPAAIKNFCAYSLKRLGTGYIDIYRIGRVDPSVPIEETIGGMSELVKAGHIRHIGLSEAGADTLRRAHKIHPIADLQIEYSLLSRGIEREILPVCRELGIGITAYGVLSRGLLSGHWSKERAVAPNDFRQFGPRFSAGNIDHNLRLIDQLAPIAERRGSSIAQLAIAWVLSRGADIVPLFGARRREQLGEALDALTARFTDEDFAAAERVLPPGAAAGERYAPQLMKWLDSEKSAG